MRALTRPTVERNLDALFSPRSVAVVGASNDLSKWGGDIAARLLQGPGSRAIFLVNRKGGRVQGRQAYGSLRELPQPVDLVFLAMPASSFLEAVDDALAAGAKALVVISAGLGELGAEGRMQERLAAERVRAAGAVMVGPNCPGIADTTSSLIGLAFMTITPGPIGFISQSGSVGEEIALRLREIGQGFTRCVMLGNQADLGIADVLWSFTHHESTRLVAVYAEDLRDGRRLVRAARAVVSCGKPVLLLATGQCDASARAALSHTGSLTSDSAVVDAVCRASGATRVRTPAELVELAEGLLSSRRPKGRRVGIVSDSGGLGAVAADVAAAAGLEVPQFSPPLSARLRAVLPDNAAVKNPVDFAIASTDASAHARVGKILASSGEIDALLMSGSFGFFGANFGHLQRETEEEKETARTIARLARETAMPVVAATVHASAPAPSILRDSGVPVYREVRAAVEVLWRLASMPGLDIHEVPDIPPREEPVKCDDYWAAREALAAAGVPFVAASLVRDRGQAVAAAAALGYPVVLKAIGLLHKSDSGGVALDLQDEQMLMAAWDSMQRHVAPPAMVVEHMAKSAGAIEVIVGCRQDSRFGPVVLVGLGGVYAEVLDDTLVALAPLENPAAVGLLLSLRAAPLLLETRGRPALDVAAAASVVVAISRFAAVHPEIAEVEVNPLLVTVRGAVALDARIVLREQSGGSHDELCATGGALSK